MKIQFWGVRGCITCSSPSYDIIGGHTSCVSVEVDNHLIIFDAGSGLRDLGLYIKNNSIKSAILCLSHGHYDHIVGLPFFGPLWDNDFDLTIIGGPIDKCINIQDLVTNKIFSSPLFPVPFTETMAKISFKDINHHQKISLTKTITLTGIGLNHPGGATGYKVENADKSICYITDHEHISETVSTPRHLRDFIKDTNLMIYDATFTDEQYVNYKGWGHSTWQKGIELSKEAHVKKLALFHHNPEHTDDIMMDIEKQAQAVWPLCFVARQGMENII